MSREGYRRNTPLLLILLVSAAVYVGWHYVVAVPIALDTLDGGIGILLGLFICSRPAANGIDLIFFERGGLRLAFSGWSGVEWLMLNALVLFAGWLVIVVGASHIS